MTQNDVKTIFDGATDAQVKAILDLNSSDIGKAKKECDTLRTELDEAKNKVQSYETEIGGLRDSVDEAEKLKTRVEELQKAIDDRKAADEKAERETAERAEFDKYFADNNREWSNPFIADGYFGKFKEAKKAPENSGKMSADILHELTKDDKTAFKGVTAEVKLPGVQPFGGIDADAETAKARAVMGLA